MPLRNLAMIAAAAAVSFVCLQKASQNRYAASIVEAMDIIAANALEEVEPAELFEGAMDGMAGKVDEHSDFIPRGDYLRMREDLDQKFGGLGIHVEKDAKTERLKVVVPIPNTPAYLAGLKPGDQILRIDGTDTTDMNMNDAVRRMRGPEGESVTLAIGRAGKEDPIDMKIKRAIIPIHSVKGDTRRADGGWDFYLASHPNIAYVRVTTFGERTASELKKALEFGDREIDALILDLRDNPGGLLKSAVAICDMFVDKTYHSGRIVTTKDRDGSIRDEHFADDETQVPKSLPVVVMINGMSASASEIVAACLADHKRAFVVGERSWGKGTVQNIIPMEGGQSALKLTTASYWRPNDKNIHRRRNKEGKRAGEDEIWGVRPATGYAVKLKDEQRRRLYRVRRQRDFENLLGPDNEPMVIESDAVDKTDPSSSASADPQLDKAVEYLLEKLESATRVETPAA